MVSSIGVNLRVTGHCAKGDRKYMEDYFSVAYQQSEDEKDLEYAFFGIYDGHGGQEAAVFAKEHLMNAIVSQKLFWSENDDDVLKAIHEGYLATHLAMWRIQDKWPKTSSGLPSTAGTTASVAFIRHGKIYIGHVGDSGIVLGYQQNENDKFWVAEPLTQDHKPECKREQARIENSGGKVVVKSGVPRVVWNRPRIGHKGPVRRSTPIDEIPFLAVARSLGDLWSYNSNLNEFVVSPEPDVRVIKIDAKKFRCLIFGTDGLWNVLLPGAAVDIVRQAEAVNDSNAYVGGSKEWKNPSKCLVDRALQMWSNTRMRADNTSVVTIMLDPAGPPKKETLKHAASSQQTNTNPNSYIIDYAPYIQQVEDRSATLLDHSTHEAIDMEASGSSSLEMPTSGLAVMTRFETNSVTTATIDGSYHHGTMAYEGASSSSAGSSQDIMYMDSFAESYNSLLTSSLNDHSYVPEFAQQIGGESHRSSEETYSLINLQTRNERMQEAATQPSYLAEPSTSTAPVNRRPSSPFSQTFHDYHLNYANVHPQNAGLQQPSHNPPPSQFHQMERYNYLQTNAHSYHNINNSNPSLLDANPLPEVTPTPEDAVEQTTPMETDEGAEEDVEGETSNVSDDKINNNKNDVPTEDDESTIQIHEISSSNLNLVAAISPSILEPATVPEEEEEEEDEDDSCDISTSSKALLNNKENVKKPAKSTAQHQTLFHEKKDTRSSAFRLRNGKKLTEMVDSSKRIKRKVKSMFHGDEVIATTSKASSRISDNRTVGRTIKEKVQNFTSKTLNMVQTVMKENTLNLRSTRNHPKPTTASAEKQQQQLPKTPTKAPPTKKEFRRSIGEKLTNLSMRSASAMKRSKSAMKITRIMTTRKSSATSKSAIPFLLTPTLPAVASVRNIRLRKDDKALQEKNNNDGFETKGKRRRTAMGLTSTPYAGNAAKSVTQLANKSSAATTPPPPEKLVRTHTKRLSARNNPWCPASTNSSAKKSTTPSIQSNNKKVQKRFSK